MSEDNKTNTSVNGRAYENDIPEAGEINLADEVKGVKLVLIVFTLCFSNILTGVVGGLEDSSSTLNIFSNFIVYLGLHINRNSCSGHQHPVQLPERYWLVRQRLPHRDVLRPWTICIVSPN
jgi:hypothetical protein